MPRKKERKIDELKGLLECRLLPCPPGPPRTDEECRIFYINLVRLKAMRLTNEECATRLGVGESTIRKYTADEYYQELRDEIVGDSKDRGHFLISELLDDATKVLYDLMINAKSEFVRLKAVELAYESAGLKEPKDTVKRNARDEVAEFLKHVEAKRLAEQQAATSVQQVVESLPALPPGISPELKKFYQPVGEGGTLPASFRSGRDERKKRDSSS